MIVDRYLKNIQKKFEILVKRIGHVNKELVRELTI